MWLQIHTSLNTFIVVIIFDKKKLNILANTLHIMFWMKKYFHFKVVKCFCASIFAQDIMVGKIIGFF